MRRPVVWIAAAVLLAAGIVVAAVRGCGPSGLAVAYEAYVARLGAQLDDEDAFSRRLMDAFQGQDDADGLRRYRSFLEQRALPYYAEFERRVAALEPGHPRLEPAQQAVVRFAGLRRAFVDLELRRLATLRDAAAVDEVARLQEAMDDAHEAYLELVGDDVPDPRLATLKAEADAFLMRRLEGVLAGLVEPAAAEDSLRRVVIPAFERVRHERHEETPRARAFRSFVAASEEFFRKLAAAFPKVVEARRAARRVEENLKEAEELRAAWKKALGEAQRDR